VGRRARDQAHAQGRRRPRTSSSGPPAGHQAGPVRPVWSNTVVSDDALTTCIQELRKALRDDAKQPRYLEDRHRYGYCFVAS
jgi:hypothetical protein